MAYKVNLRSERNAEIDADVEALEAEKNKLFSLDKAPKDDIPQNEDNPQDKTDWKKRHADLRSYSQKEINELKKANENKDAQIRALTEKQVKFPKTEEEVTAWVERYPDVAAIVETIAMKKVADVRKEMATRDEALQAASYQVEFDKHLNRISHAHSDFFAIREDDDFITWLQKQPRYARVAFSDDPVEFDDLEDMADTVISTLDLYKAKHSKKKDVDPRREAAKSVVNKGSGIPNEVPENMILESDIDKMSIKEYEKHEVDIMKAMRENRIVYDISGAAR